MGVRIHSVIVQARQALKEKQLEKKQQCKATKPGVPKGFIPVYVGDVQQRRFIVPVSYLNHPKFQELLERSAEEFDFSHPMGGLTIPCKEDDFISVISQLKLF
ncbi:hypothetical protein DCAR_0623104 [Daucus carota subsp. sativus]|uniref:Uncharacterized protein n=1 Tax=Daucus carota subsp. sativus TaxID=79200 RepID=A0AAF0X921_DAUCS|nr:hypothetical protein DCAR_0623104 [Daucus carota subsp. sativus]